MKKFTHKLLLVSAFLFGASAAMAQGAYQTIGIIGTAVPIPAGAPDAWTVSTPMTLQTGAGSNGHQWVITKTLLAGDMKFRANDAWTVNWGNDNMPNFPGGLGVQDKANIVVPAGTYRITFDDQTGAYNFGAPLATFANASKLSLSVAPNPASKDAASVSYELSTAALVTVTLKNAIGQTVRQFPSVQQGAGRQEQRLSLNGLASGLYLVQVQNGTQKQMTRLVVQ